jgi:hypothetical protein
MRYMDLTIEEIMTKYERIKDEKGYWKGFVDILKGRV